MTLKQAQLMESWSIIPMIVVELELDTVEVMKRSLVDKMKPSKWENMHQQIICPDIYHNVMFEGCLKLQTS